MKATGVVRRIDDLGRIVIPKELRRTMRIKEGDSLEIFIETNDKIVLRKYSPVQNINEFIAEFVQSIYETTKKEIIITDTERIIASAIKGKKDIVGHKISMRLEERLNNRQTQIVEKGEFLDITENHQIKNPSIIKPINVYGDILGLVIIVGDNEITDVEKNLAEFAGTFFCKYLEG